MPKSKLTAVEYSTDTVWTSQQGVGFYRAEMKFEDGTQGDALCRSKDFEIGKEYEFETQATQYGTKVKIQRNSGYQPRSYNRTSEAEKVPSIAVSYALRHLEGQGASLNELLAVAQKIQDHILEQQKSVK